MFESESNKGIMVINGQMVNLFDLSQTPYVLSFSNLAQGLTKIIRFNGYSDLSVAVHSLVLSHIAENVTANLLMSKNNSALLQNMFGEKAKKYLESEITTETVDYISACMGYDALIHDFSESLTGDVIRPFKLLIKEISRISDKVDKQIREYYKVDEEMPLVVDILDKMLASIEAYYLTRYHGVHLINTAEEIQIKMFNDVFFAEGQERETVLRAVLWNDAKFYEKAKAEKHLPLSEDFVYRFLMNSCEVKNCMYKISYSELANSMDQLKGKSDKELLLQMNHRFISLRNRMEKAFL